MSTQEKLNSILLDLLDIEESDIVADAKLFGDLNISSVDLVEIAAAIENEFDIDIPDDDLPSLRTIGLLVAYIDEKLHNKD